MTRWLIIFALTASTLSLIAGCPPKKQGPDKPVAETHQGGSQPAKVAQPAVAEPNAPEKTKPSEPVVVEPNAPAAVEPNKPQPAEPNIPEPNQAKAAEPNNVDVNEAAVAEPNEAAAAEPNQATAVEPNEVKVAEPNTPEPNLVGEPNKPSTNVVVDANESSAAKFHSLCAEIFKTYVDKDGFVDYSTLARKRLELKAVLSRFDKLDRDEYRSWPTNDKIAFWINAYNLQMMHIIAQNYPIRGSRFYILMYGPESIRHITGIWTDYKFMVMREQFNLDQIEKRYFRQQFKDPRILFALQQGSVSGPPLRNEPYTGVNLDAQLNEQMKRFLSSSRAFEIDKTAAEVRVSPMFEATWYGKELMDKYGTELKFKSQPSQTRAILNFISAFVPKTNASYLEVGNYSVQFIKYDWTVNDITNK